MFLFVICSYFDRESPARDYPKPWLDFLYHDQRCAIEIKKNKYKIQDFVEKSFIFGFVQIEELELTLNILIWYITKSVAFFIKICKCL